MYAQDRTHIKSHGGRSFSKFPSSPSTTDAFRKRSLNKPTYSKQSKKQPLLPKRRNLLNLPLHTKCNMSSSSSPKRSNSGDIDNRPSKLQKVGKLITGLEGSEHDFVGVMSHFNSPSEVTALLDKEYLLRHRVLSYSKQMRLKRRLATAIKAEKTWMRTGAQKGMPNKTGFLCYRNSLLQALFHSAKFNYWVQQHQANQCVADNQDDCVACNLREVVQYYWAGSRSDLSIVLENLYQLFTDLGWERGQQDPEEMFNWITNMMSKNLPTSAYSSFEAVNSVITDSCIKCTACGHISKTQAHANSSLSVPLQPRCNGGLDAYIDHYLKEKIEGYKCEMCKDTSDKYRRQEIVHSPDILMIQLKRFAGWGNGKDNYLVRDIEHLSLNKYRAAFNKVNSDYRLFASVVHRGSKDSGHYMCNAKSGDEWFEFDDTNINRVSSSAVLTQQHDRFTPYLLFYQRVSKKEGHAGPS